MARSRQETLFEFGEKQLFNIRDRATPDVVTKSMSEIVNDNNFNFLKGRKGSLLTQPRHIIDKHARGDLPIINEDDIRLVDTQRKLFGEAGQGSLGSANPMGSLGDMSSEQKTGERDIDNAVKLSRQINFPRAISRRKMKKKLSGMNDVALLQEAIANYRARQNVFNVVPRGHITGRNNQLNELFSRV